MTEITDDIKREISFFVREYFADECEVDIENIKNETKIIEDLDGDSLMFLSLLEIIRKKYDVNVEIKTIGKRLMQRPANTISELIEMVILVVKYGENIPDVVAA